MSKTPLDFQVTFGLKSRASEICLHISEIVLKALEILFLK